ncbi:unnamed protein product [Hermetia illucens]|uniref:GBD/FH3 domain-containing protein n=1 Tax=Hermetia illucens TaxID=343691 RepID=A0A7R8UWD5_HERIL|nr:unnamed protein product [Hermetia illucens]
MPATGTSRDSQKLQRLRDHGKRELSSYCIGYQMAPSACHTPPGSKMTTDISMSWPPNFTAKENQRPPVYNPEDYIQSLKKFGKRQSGNAKSIYDNSENDNKATDGSRSATLPTKCSQYMSPIPTEPDSEMTLRQFGSVTDLLTKLRSDLRASFPSFVQEFVSSPMDGVSLLLEVLRAIQLSQTMGVTPATLSSSMPRNAQSYQRRALLDELACLQCLSICCCRSPEASARLGTTPVGLLPLAASATGQGIRARILALQLLTVACDKNATSHGSQKCANAGHSAVSEALATLRLRCGEPVRFRLLIGMLNSGGGSGELQAFGIKFINTFLKSAENLQNRLYLQAELFQAGFDPHSMTKTISSTSPWLDKLRAEIKYFEEIKIDVERLQIQARESERIRSQMVILERRVQILQEEKSVLTSMERRLQERCAELQRDIFRLQGVQSDSYKSLEKRPIALPRLIPPGSKQASSDHDDEGISSSETGPSLSPVPIMVLPQKKSQKFSIMLGNGDSYENKDEDATIEDVIEELENIVSDEQKNGTTEYPPSESTILINDQTRSALETTKEKDIVPVNLLPQPPRKSRSLAHLMSQGGSDLDASEYGLLLIHNNSRTSFFEDIDFDLEKSYAQDENIDQVDAVHTSTNREILDVIMKAREVEDDPHLNALRASSPIQIHHTSPVNPPPAQQFNGVFFMTEMNTPQKYPKPDVAAALQARRVSKNIDRFENYGLDSMIDIVLTSGEKEAATQIYFAQNGVSSFKTSTGLNGSSININSGSVVKDTTRTRSNTGSKVTDIPSGLY